MKDIEKVRFKEIIDGIENGEIVLPDFQRGFVWRDKNKQRALIASVLAKLPIGTVLFLEAEPKDYGCKKIGRTNRDNGENVHSKVNALLDGQQRITVLTAFFSNLLYRDTDEANNIASPTLLRRYFLKLDSFQSVIKQDKDFWGIRTLKLPEGMKKKEYPSYLSGDIIDKIDCIEYIERNKDGNEVLYGDIDIVNEKDLCSYCVDRKKHKNSYVIPLFYLYGATNCENENHENRLRAVTLEIAQCICSEILEYIKRSDVTNDEKIEYLQDCLNDNPMIAERMINKLQEMRDEENEDYKSFKEIMKTRCERWSEQICTYLESCLSDMALYKITVGGEDKLRAIDIYENLNLGGKALDVFDLILAKAAKKENSKNLLEIIQEFIHENHIQDYGVFVKKCEKEKQIIFQNAFQEDSSYCAAKGLGCWNEKEKELNPAFCEALMDMMGIIDYFTAESGNLVFEESSVTKLTSAVTKKESLLKIESEKIEDYIKIACVGLDRACMFLNLRCGIRNISEINYKLMLVVLGVVFTKKDYFDNEKILDYLEAWYWAAIFSGEFKSEQNKAFNNNLKEILLFVSSRSQSGCDAFVVNLCENIFNDAKFANREILLLENKYIEPEDVLRNTICQFYLAKSYCDILKEMPSRHYEPSKISVYCDCAESLNKHHLMPIGELTTCYKDVVKKIDTECKDNIEVRKDKKNKYNSPLNFVLISAKANNIISNHELSSYIDMCNSSALGAIGVPDKYSTLDFTNVYDLNKFLNHRFGEVQKVLRAKLTTLLGKDSLEFKNQQEDERIVERLKEQRKI